MFFLGKEELKKRRKKYYILLNFTGVTSTLEHTQTHRTFELLNERTLWRRITSTRDERSKRRRCAKALCICTISKCCLIFFFFYREKRAFFILFLTLLFSQRRLVRFLRQLDVGDERRILRRLHHRYETRRGERRRKRGDV